MAPCGLIARILPRITNSQCAETVYAETRLTPWVVALLAARAWRAMPRPGYRHNSKVKFPQTSRAGVQRVEMRLKRGTLTNKLLTAIKAEGVAL
jgi:hypothetical protein